MLEFRTLGTTDLRGEDGQCIESVLLHTKRTALLAYLCAFRPHGLHRRSTLVALLWPEADEPHARGALRHELSHLRRALGPGVIVGEGDESIGVDARRLWCDAREVEAALDAGRPQDALGLWHGEFLPGLSVPGGEFDRWLDGTRDRLLRRVVAAGRELSRNAEQAGDAAGAIAWARRLNELAPHDEGAWQRLIVLLDRSGDRSGALAAYEEFVMKLREDLDVEPSPETRALVDGIRARRDLMASPADLGPLASVSVGRSPPGNAGAANAQGRETPSEGDAGPSVSRSAPAPGSLRRRLRPMLLAAPAIAVLALAFEVMDAASSSLRRVVVEFPRVENQTGDTALEPLRRRVEDELAEALSTVEFVELVAPGNRDRVEALVSGSLYRQGEFIEARLRVVEAEPGGRAIGMPAPVLLSPADPGPAMDSLVVSVLVPLALRYDPRFDAAGGAAERLEIRLPLYEAYLQYVRGSDLFGMKDYSAAAPRLMRAYQIDPKFGKAAVFGAIALALGGQPAAADSFASELLAENDSLTDFERAFGEWFLADLTGRRGDAYTAARKFERAGRGASPSAIAVAGREAMRMNRPREAAAKFAHVDTEHGWLRNYTELWEGWAGAYHMLGDHRAELQKIQEARERFPSSLEILRAAVRARSALGEPREVERLMQEAFTLAPAQISPAEVAWVAAQELATHGQAAAAERARRAGLEWLSGRTSGVPGETLLRVRLLSELGEAGEAARLLASAPPVRDLHWLAVSGLVAAQHGDTATTRATLERLEAARNPYLSGQHLLLAVGERLALGEPERAMETLRRALAAGLPFGVELHALPLLRPLHDTPALRELLRPRG